MVRVFCRFCLLTLLALTTVCAWAQTPPPSGTPPFGSFAGGPDVINLANLNSHIAIPVIHKAGRGLPFTYDLSYDTSVWFPIAVSGAQTWQPVLNFGWRGITEIATGYVSTNVTTIQCLTNGTPTGGAVIQTNWVYHDPFGISHPFAFGDLTTVSGTGCRQPPVNTFPQTAIDGSGYVMKINDPSLGNALISPTGEVINLTGLIDAASGSGVATDRNGNKITADGVGHFYDTLNASTPVLTVSGSGTPNSPTTFTYTSPSGGSPAYTMNYANYTVATNFGVSGIHEYAATVTPLVTSIGLPDNTQYTFTYEPTPSTPSSGACTPLSGTTSCVTGRLRMITIPTGGQITYSYTGGNNGILSDGSAAGLTRTTPYGIWKYARTIGTGAASTTTVTDPTAAGNQTVIQFQGIYETQRQVYQGAAGGTLLLTTNTCYNGTTSPASTASCVGTPITLPITQRALTTFLPGAANLESQHVDNYNSFGSIADTEDYDYRNDGVAGIGPLVRKTVITFATLGNIKAFRQIVTVQDGGGNTISHTTYSYDETAVVAPPNQPTPQHVSVAGARGNLTSISYPAGGLTSHLTYYDTGNIQTSQDVNGSGSTTTYNYGSLAATCGNTFPTSLSEPLGLSRSLIWNCTGGVVTQAKDENLQITKTDYTDPDFWRPFSVTDASIAKTTFAYNGATSTEAVLPVSTGNSAVDILQTLDAAGNPTMAQVRRASGVDSFDTISVAYDAAGRLFSTSVPCVSTAHALCPSTPATSTTYDALNRPLLVQDAGNGFTSYSYPQNDVFVTVGPAPSGENTKRRQLEYDSLGRLTSVCEITAGTIQAPAGTCAQTVPQTGYWTKYAYSTTASSTSVTTVTQNAQASGNHQTRTYISDALGRLISEVNPESGTTTYTYDSASSCPTPNSFPGDLVKRVDNAGNTTCNSYDTLHRVISRTYSGPNASGMPNKYFVYDMATINTSPTPTAMVNVKGRLAEAYTAISPTGAKTTDVGFSYTVRGEISDEYQSSPNSAGYYHENLLYWENGVTKQVSGLPYLPTFTYAVDGEGRLNSISASAGQSPLTSTAYNPASLPTTVTLGSLDSDAFTYDPNTNRMTKYQFNINGQTFTGTSTWNANGTLGALNITDPFNSSDSQNCSYSHDDLIRIASVNCGVSTWQQNFTYDAFGNLTKSVPTNGTGISFQPTYSLATNQMSNIAGFIPSYDADGNVLNDNLNTYTWDAQGKPASINGISNILDALGRNIDSGSQTATFYSADGSFRITFNGQLARRAYVQLPGGGRAIFDVCGGGLFEYDHPDHLGSIRLGSTSSRGFAFSQSYAPFGELYARSNNTQQGFFTGLFPGSFDLYNAPAREYGDQGRWASPDPAGLSAVNPGSPQSWNRYAYVSNRPLSVTDPSGLCDVVVAGITQTPGTPNTEAQQKFAQGIGANQAFPFAGQGTLGSLNSLGGTAPATVVSNAIQDAISQTPDGQKVNLFVFSGGAEEVSQVLANATPEVQARIGNITYLSPGITADGPPLATGTGSTQAYFGHGSTEVLVTAVAMSSAVAQGIQLRSYDCEHNANCAFSEAQLAPHGEACKDPTTFSLGGAFGGGIGIDVVLRLYGSRGFGWDPFDLLLKSFQTGEAEKLLE